MKEEETELGREDYTLSIVLLMGGAGDFLIVWMMRKLKGDTMVKDHHSAIGFYVLNEGER